MATMTAIDRADGPATPPAPAALPVEVTPASFRLPPAAAHLTAEQVEELGRELDAIRQRHDDDLGEVDAAYIRRLIRLQRVLEASGRGLLFAGFLPPAWLGGVAALGLAKILDNMEIGHNILHGQYDWMQDPAIHSSAYEWDNAAPADQWKQGHNVVHHTWTNVIGMDRDVGYGLLRITDQQPWRARDLGNPAYALALALLFEYGVALHGLEMEALMEGEGPMEEAGPLLAAIGSKAGAQAKKDYLLFPALAGPLAPFVLSGNVAANVMRNVWAFTIIFCGHFPDGTEMFTEEDIEGETRARWYLRQMLGSANLTGSPLFHVLSGNLSHQIEHHLFPDLPARRYAAIAEEVQEVCERYGLPYNTGPLSKQFGSVVRTIVRLAVPDGTARREGRVKFTDQVSRVTAPVSKRIDRLAEVGAAAREERRAA